MKFNWSRSIALFGLSTFLLTVTAIAQNRSLRPPLVVGIVVDQMRWDYLYRFYDLYGNDGFKRLLSEGNSCQNTTINYLPAFTAPGHSCIYTGTVPAIHGIAANDWIENATGLPMYCTEDKTVTGVGTNGKQGQMSPKNLWASTITDELKLATNGHSKVFGISLKDRGAILPAGHMANGAFWFDLTSGNFISSNFYMNDLPRWVQQFNNRKIADSLLSLNWNLLYSSEKYTQSTADSTRYEGLQKGEIAPVFPHLTQQYVGKSWKIMPYTPYGNTIVRMLAECCLVNENLGKGTATDFLAVSFSSTDYIGHYYGVNAMETEDVYLRLDQEIGKLLSSLDKQVGKGNYLVFLTADHGGAHNSDFLIDRKLSAGNDHLEDKLISLNNAAKSKFQQDSIVRTLDNYQVTFNKNRLTGLNNDSVRNFVMDWLLQQPEMAYVIDLQNIDKSPAPSNILEMVRNGFNRERSGDIQFILKPGWFSHPYNTGTTHGTWNPYDTHIPLIWFGWGITKGVTNQETHMTDISATLATLLHIQQPNGCIGKAITNVIAP